MLPLANTAEEPWRLTQSLHETEIRKRTDLLLPLKVFEIDRKRVDRSWYRAYFDQLGNYIPEFDV